MCVPVNCTVHDNGYNGYTIQKLCTLNRKCILGVCVLTVNGRLLTTVQWIFLGDKMFR